MTEKWQQLGEVSNLAKRKVVESAAGLYDEDVGKVEDEEAQLAALGAVALHEQKVVLGVRRS